MPLGICPPRCSITMVSLLAHSRTFSLSSSSSPALSSGPISSCTCLVALPGCLLALRTLTVEKSLPARVLSTTSLSMPMALQTSTIFSIATCACTPKATNSSHLAVSTPLASLPGTASESLLKTTFHAASFVEAPANRGLPVGGPDGLATEPSSNTRGSRCCSAGVFGGTNVGADSCAATSCVSTMGLKVAWISSPADDRLGPLCLDVVLPAVRPLAGELEASVFSSSEGAGAPLCRNVAAAAPLPTAGSAAEATLVIGKSQQI
mmetsp:Transcript_18980/g.44235  ORF Transcript_18980/g.44235 Transcript_18980/m.44235 type:complete len:264 (-) Transcript_18980:84-875(-)